MNKECLVLFSGGKDSMLASILLIEQGYKVILVHYDNMCTIGCSNVKYNYNKLLKKYGKDKVEYLGTKNISCFFRSFIKETYNYSFDYLKNEFGNGSISELNCLSCRLSMYIASVIICKKRNIKYVADGARSSQLFAIEQKEILNLFNDFFKNYSIDFLLPVIDLKNDFDEKNQFIARGIVPKVYESQCLLGIPLKEHTKNENSVKMCTNIYEKVYKDIALEMVEKYANIELGDSFI